MAMDQRQMQQQFPTLSDQQPGGTGPMSPPQAQARAPRPQGPMGRAQGPAYQNFRQMQQQGQARPAPWGFTPPPQPQAQQQAQPQQAPQAQASLQQVNQPMVNAMNDLTGPQVNPQAQSGAYQPPTVTPYTGGTGQTYTPQGYTPGPAYQAQSFQNPYTPQAMNAPQYQAFGGQPQGQVQAPAGAGGGTSSQVSSLLQQMMANPTAYDDNVIQAQRRAAMSNLDQQASASQSALDEEMARRGVYASSVAGGRMGDIASNRLRAIQDLESNFLTNRANAMDAGRQAAASLGLQSDSLNQQGSLAAARMGLDAQMANQDNAFRYSNLGAQDRQFGAGLGRDYAQMGMQDRQFGAGLGRDYARMGQDDRQFGADLGMRDRQFGANLAQNDRQFGANYALDRDRFGYDRYRDERNFNEDRFRDGRDFDWRAIQELLANYGGAGLSEF